MTTPSDLLAIWLDLIERTRDEIWWAIKEGQDPETYTAEGVELQSLLEQTRTLQTDRLTIGFDVLKKIEHLNLRRDSNLDDFGRDTCCDYVDSLHFEAGRYGVTVFVEPCGDITKWGQSWDAVLEWWIVVFASQPDGWDYCRAGWHLHEVAERGLLDDPLVVWADDDLAQAGPDKIG